MRFVVRGALYSGSPCDSAFLFTPAGLRAATIAVRLHAGVGLCTATGAPNASRPACLAAIAVASCALLRLHHAGRLHHAHGCCHYALAHHLLHLLLGEQCIRHDANRRAAAANATTRHSDATAHGACSGCTAGTATPVRLLPCPAAAVRLLLLRVGLLRARVLSLRALTLRWRTALLRRRRRRARLSMLLRTLLTAVALLVTRFLHRHFVRGWERRHLAGLAGHGVAEEILVLHSAAQCTGAEKLVGTQAPVQLGRQQFSLPRSQLR